MLPEIDIMGVPHKIRIMKNYTPTEGMMGRGNIINSEIVIAEEMSPDMKNQTLLHEILHLVSDFTSSKLKEDQVNAISAGLYQVIKANPGIFKHES